MRRLLLPALCLLSALAVAQTDTSGKTSPKMTTMVMSGAQLNKMFGPMTDRRIYDEAGSPVDSVDAFRRVKSFEYTLGLGQINHEGPYKRMLFKVKPERQRMTDSMIRKSLAPTSAKLQEGIALDLSPFGSRIDAAKVEGKAIILIFWYSGCYGNQPDVYADINEIVEKYIDGKKFEVYAITQNAYDVATNALKKSPILNAHMLFEAEGINKGYNTENHPQLVVTDKNHKIIYAIRGNAQITPRILDGLLKNL